VAAEAQAQAQAAREAALAAGSGQWNGQSRVARSNRSGDDDNGTDREVSAARYTSVVRRATSQRNAIITALSFTASLTRRTNSEGRGAAAEHGDRAPARSPKPRGLSAAQVAPAR
jgi:hypothetical protein